MQGEGASTLVPNSFLGIDSHSSQSASIHTPPWSASSIMSCGSDCTSYWKAPHVLTSEAFPLSLFLSLKMRPRFSSSSFPTSFLDLRVMMSSGFILQICTTMPLSLRWRFGVINGQVSLAWSITIHMQK